MSTDEFFGLFLSRSIFVPKISHFLTELMDTKGMNLYQEKNPEELAGKTFSELVIIFKEKLGAISIGIVRENMVIVNPEKEMEIKKDDELLYIAGERLKTA